VPVNTGEQLKRTVTKYLRADIPFDVASTPNSSRKAPRSRTPSTRTASWSAWRARAPQAAARHLRPDHQENGCPLPEMNIASAELTKHASNSFLAMKISFINAVSRVCELAGADVEQVAQGMGLDKRIGPSSCAPGVGYGGSCFPKDVDAFVQIADHLGYNFELLKEVQRINKTQREHLMQKIQHELWVIQDKVIAVLGLAFKPGTDDVRESPSLYFVPQLIEAGAKLRLWDPVGEEAFRAALPRRAVLQGPARVRDRRRPAADPDRLAGGQETGPRQAQERHEVPGHR
jgi:UDPglucose 6-dehydrogenase